MVVMVMKLAQMQVMLAVEAAVLALLELLLHLLLAETVGLG
jgi:hypothetical protein